MGGPGSGRKRSATCYRGHDKKGLVNCPECAAISHARWEKTKRKIVVWVDDDLMDGLSEVCAENEIPRATFVRELIEAAVASKTSSKVEP